MQIELVAIDSLIPDPDNAKIHTPEQISAIAESIKAFGNNDPIGISGDNLIIEGEGRWLALKQLGHAVVAVIRLDHLDDARRRAYALAHNQLNARTGLDPVRVKVNIEAIKVAGVDVKSIGFTASEIRKMNARKESNEEAEQALAAGTSQDFVPFAQPGDLWHLGPHRVLCGDSTSEQCMQRVMEGNTVDLVLTDPPYNVAYEGGTGLTIENDSMPDSDFRAFLFAMYSNAFKVTKPGGGIYVFHADSEGYNFRGALVDAGWMMKQCLIWIKDRLVLGRQDYHWQHEPILKAWKPGASHTWNGDRTQTTLLRFNRPSRSGDHPTMKPVEMLEYLIKNSSSEKQVVLDPFLGSGSTLIAAEQTDRICHGLELSPRYASVIVKRWAELTKETPTVKRGERVFTMAEAVAAANGSI